MQQEIDVAQGQHQEVLAAEDGEAGDDLTQEGVHRAGDRHEDEDEGVHQHCYRVLLLRRPRHQRFLHSDSSRGHITRCLHCAATINLAALTEAAPTVALILSSGRRRFVSSASVAAGIQRCRHSSDFRHLICTSFSSAATTSSLVFLEDSDEFRFQVTRVADKGHNQEGVKKDQQEEGDVQEDEAGRQGNVVKHLSSRVVRLCRLQVHDRGLRSVLEG